MVPLLSLARQHEDDLNEATPLTAVIDGRDASVDFAYMLGAAQKSKVSVPLLSKEMVFEEAEQAEAPASPSAE